MKIYVINLKRRTDRLEKIIKSFEKFKFTNYEIVEAYDALSFKIDPRSISKNMDRVERELSGPEICTSLSHNKTYDIILQSKDHHAVVIEDDCPITEALINFVNQDNRIDCEVTLLTYFSSNSTNINNSEFKPQSYNYEIMDECSATRVYFKKEYNKIGDYLYHRFDDKTIKVDFLNSAQCYYITRQGCQRFLKLNTPILVNLDCIWNYHAVDLYGIRPPLCVAINDFSIDSDLQKDRNKYQHTKLHSKSFVNRKRNPLFGC
tara:strand:+ start:818 stop:1603 length:786 start_codon:yes stop_codon:yes gene_type:complete